MRPYILAETNWKTVKETDYQLAVLPWGATEAHNYHLPYSTDSIEAETIAAGAAKVAWEKGARVIVLPAVPFGVNTGQHDIKLDLNLNPRTQFLVLNDILETLSRQGILRFAILNSHGGNDFRQMLRELGLKFPKMFLSEVDWYKMKEQKDLFDDLGEHAGEVETSLMLYFKPEWMRPLDEAGDGASRKYRFDGMKEGWAWAERRWSEVTADTGIGNPARATSEKGKCFFDLMCQKIGNYLFELAQADDGDWYE